MKMAVGLTEYRKSVFGHFAEDANRKAGAGKRVAPNNRIGKSKFRRHRPRFIFEEKAQGFDNLERHIFGKSADVVVRFNGDGLLVRAAALNHVGVQRSLREVRDAGI